MQSVIGADLREHLGDNKVCITAALKLSPLHFTLLLLISLSGFQALFCCVSLYRGMQGFITACVITVSVCVQVALIDSASLNWPEKLTVFFCELKLGACDPWFCIGVVRGSVSQF